MQTSRQHAVYQQLGYTSLQRSPRVRQAPAASGASPRYRTYHSGSPSPQRRALLIPSSEDVHSMLTELMGISQSIAKYLEAGAVTPPGSGLPTPRTGRQQSILKAQEIERIVRRVEAHFTAKVTALTDANQGLERQVRELSAEIATQRAFLDGKTVSNVENCHRRTSQGNERTCQREGEVSRCELEAGQLREALQAEKRQRLLVEEQTQRLTEQHAKVVSTLERRLRKQEEQLRDLIGSLDGNPTIASGGSNGTDAQQQMHTPRRLLRQQLAQNQQTHHLLHEYQRRLDMENDNGGATPNSEAAEEELQPTGEVRKTLVSIKNRRPSISGASDTVAIVPHSKARVAPGLYGRNSSALQEVDDISAFLDNITRELESLETE